MPPFAQPPIGQRFLCLSLILLASDAQPLYVAGIHTSLTNCSPSCDMIIAATLNDTVFAWNASSGAQVWSRQGTGGTSNALWYDDCGSPGRTGNRPRDPAVRRHYIHTGDRLRPFPAHHVPHQLVQEG